MAPSEYERTHYVSACATGPVFTGLLLALSYTIWIRESYSNGPLFPICQVQPDHSKSGGAGPVCGFINLVLAYQMMTVNLCNFPHL